MAEIERDSECTEDLIQEQLELEDSHSCENDSCNEIHEKKKKVSERDDSFRIINLSMEYSENKTD